MKQIRGFKDMPEEHRVQKCADASTFVRQQRGGHFMRKPRSILENQVIE